MDSFWPHSRNHTCAPDTNLSVFSLAIEFKVSFPLAHLYYALNSMFCAGDEKVPGVCITRDSALVLGHTVITLGFVFHCKIFQIEYILALLQHLCIMLIIQINKNSCSNLCSNTSVLVPFFYLFSFYLFYIQNYNLTF